MGYRMGYHGILWKYYVKYCGNTILMGLYRNTMDNYRITMGKL